MDIVPDMSRQITVMDSTLVAVDPVTAYDAVSRPERMGRWSPENLGAAVVGGSRPAEVDMQFVGHNRRGPARWSTRCTVTAADPGRHFAFRVHAIGVRTPRIEGPIATWDYRFEPVDGGTQITETWTDDRCGWPDWAARGFDWVATSGQTFAAFQAGNIQRTLQALKRELEAQA